MKFINFEGGITRILFFSDDVDAGEMALWKEMRAAISRVVQWAFVLEFGKSYGKTFDFLGHIYIPVKDLTVCVKDTTLLKTIMETDIHFLQRWIIMADDIWVDAEIEFNSFNGVRKVNAMEVYSKGFSQDQVWPRLHWFIDKSRNEG